MWVGRACERVAIEAVGVGFDEFQVGKDGERGPDYDEAAASEVFAKSEFRIRVNLGAGSGKWTVYTCDLTHGYVDSNGAYRT